MTDLSQFNLDDVQAEGSFEPVPAGKYVAVLSAFEEKITRKESGEIEKRGINCKYEIIEGEHKGRVIFDWLNVNHPSDQAQEISRRRLKTLTSAANPNAKTMNDLLDKPITLTLNIKAATDQYPASNGVKSIEAAKTNTVATATKSSATTGGKPNWM